MKTINITIPFWVNILIAVVILLAVGNTKISLHPFFIKADWKRVVALLLFGVAFALWSISISDEGYYKGFENGFTNGYNNGFDDCKEQAIKMINKELGKQ